MKIFSKAVTIGLILATLIPSSVGAATVRRNSDCNVNYRYSYNNVLKRENIQKYITSIPSKTEEKKDTTPVTPKPVEEQKDTTEQKETPKQNSSLNAFEQEVINLTNQEREKNGLAPFKANIELSSVARTKSQDMIDKNYFDHQSPTYGSPFEMMKSFGISYRTAGENIAKGQRTAQQVVNGWMNSEGHRKNILNPNFTEIGVGYAVSPSGTAHWTQMFIG